MEIKAIFLDIDGTFYDHESNQVLPETLQACALAKEKGYKVVLCSGRPKEMADQLKVFDMFNWDGYIGSTGSIVMDENYHCINHDAFNEEQMSQIFEIAEEHEITIYSFGEHEFITREMNDYSKKMIEEFHLPIPKVRKWNNEILSAISALGIKEEITKLFSDIENISITSSTDYAIDFVRSDVNKARGIQYLMEYWGYDRNAFIAFGDSLNDIEMIKAAQIGVAMGNGVEKLKQCADKVCGSSSEPSIYFTLKELSII